MKTWVTILLLFVVMALEAGEYQVRLEWGRELPLGTLVSGVVEKVAVRPGQQVEAGTLLLSLDQREFRARLKRAQAESARAAALFAEALREEERAMELYDRGLLSDHELQKAQIGRLEAEARKFQAEEKQVQARVDLERTRLHAPVAGQITEVSTWKGQAVQNALAVQPLVYLAAGDHWRFRLRQEGTLPPGRDIEVFVDGKWQRPQQARIRQVEDTDVWILDGRLRHSGLSVGQLIKVRIR